jgi:drug/metabolite transporter (DMT)-like permease
MTDPIDRTMTPSQWAMLVVLSALWGGSFFFNGVALRELPPLTLVALRVSLAAPLLLAIARALGIKMPMDRRALLAFVAMGCLNNVVPFCLIVWGQTHIASGLASILNATTPLFALVIAHALTADEKMTSSSAAGVAVGFLGVVTMIGADAIGELGTNLAAELACLGAALTYGCASVYGRRFHRMGISPLATATGQIMASAMILVPLALLVDRPWTLANPGLWAWGAVIGLAALSTALAYVLYFRILAAAGATNILLVTFLIPVSAILLGALVLGERLDPRHFLGMALIGLGLLGIDGRLTRRVATVMVPIRD